jgi:hypothetical protein
VNGSFGGGTISDNLLENALYEYMDPFILLLLLHHPEPFSAGRDLLNNKLTAALWIDTAINQK